MKRISILVGTRPEVIKLAPVYFALKRHSEINVQLWSTGQHREMLEETLKAFELTPDHDLSLMISNQSLSELSSRALAGIGRLITENRPDLMIVQGDTTTSMIGALASFYEKVPVAHVEAGLRTYIKYNPFPEELNRILITQIAELHFTPTVTATSNLLDEGILKENIFQTGNTVIDALNYMRDKVRAKAPDEGVPSEILNTVNSDSKIILITGHRRESFGDGLKELCESIKELASEYSNVKFIFPVHLNPNVKEPVQRMLDNIPNIILSDPLQYEAFVWLMDKSSLIITDSGGIQEEAPYLGKPVLVTREQTERPEAVKSGNAKIVGTSKELIVGTVRELIEDQNIYKEMSKLNELFGDGKSAERISEIIFRYLAQKRNLLT